MEQHAHDAGRFGRLVAVADNWAAPSRVEGWTAYDVVEHLVTWLPGFLGRAGIELAPVDLTDPVTGWAARSSDVDRLLEERGDEAFESPMFGTLTLGGAITQFYTNDIWMHSWDLARAVGVDFDLGEERCAEALAGMEAMDEVLRQSGQFGPRVPVPRTASAQDRFLGFIGRDPSA